MAAPASARPLESAGSELGLQPLEPTQVIPYLSHGMGVSAEDYAGQPQDTTLASASVLGEAVKSQTSASVIPDVVERAVAAHLRTVDPITGIEVEPTTYTIEPGQSWYLVADPVPARPDDRTDRFVVGDGTPAPVTVADDGFAIDWENGVTIGLGGLALVLALALALSYMRRPRIAL